MGCDVGQLSPLARRQVERVLRLLRAARELGQRPSALARPASAPGAARLTASSPAASLPAAAATAAVSPATLLVAALVGPAAAHGGADGGGGQARLAPGLAVRLSAKPCFEAF